MKKLILLLILGIGVFSIAAAQEDIRLNVNNPKNKQTIHVKLYDASNGNYLLELPLTFHVMKGKERNILFMIAGKEINKRNPQTVWMFRQAMHLDELLKKNRNLTADKDFKKKHTAIEAFFEHSGNLVLIDFPEDYEEVRAVPKPVFFQIRDTGKPIELKLKFYVSIPGKDETMQMLTAKAGLVKTTINIIN